MSWKQTYVHSDSNDLGRDTRYNKIHYVVCSLGRLKVQGWKKKKTTIFPNMITFYTERTQIKKKSWEKRLHFCQGSQNKRKILNQRENLLA